MNELQYHMNDEQFGEMVIKTSNAFIVKKKFEMKKPFNDQFKRNKILKDKISNEVSDSKYNWITETIQVRDADEHYINYH